MPSTYAHDRFGQDVLKRLPEGQRRDATACKPLFSIGLHGPDLLFYYRPLIANPVNRLGNALHDRPASEFFLPAGEILCKSGFAPEYAAYIYGFLCHFALDRECHGYVEAQVSAIGVSHAEIEVELDRALLVRDGYDPISENLGKRIHPSRKAAPVISRFFPQVSEKKIYKAMRSMAFYNSLLCAPGRGKRQMIYTALRLAGKYESMQGMVMGYEPNPLCRESTATLLTLYDSAVEKAVRLITDFPESAAGKRPYDPLYRYTFGSEMTDVGLEKPVGQ